MKTRLHPSSNVQRITQSKSKSFPVLVLDGGGAKGVYTLGALSEIENQLDKPLHEHFKLIYGTSTGAIIAALLGLGKTVDEISEIYFNYVPQIMNQAGKTGKSRELAKLSDRIFGDLSFEAFKTDVGIVALNYTDQKPLIFKSNLDKLNRPNRSFQPGFGCRISDAVQASCSAYPVFDKKELNTHHHGRITAIDGGFLARNATLYALVDTQRMRVEQSEVDLLNIGTGKFVEKPLGGLLGVLDYFELFGFVKNLISSTNNANEELQRLLFQDVNITRIDTAHFEPRYATNMVESDRYKLHQLYNLGKDTSLNMAWTPQLKRASFFPNLAQA